MRQDARTTHTVSTHDTSPPCAHAEPTAALLAHYTAILKGLERVNDDLVFVVIDVGHGTTDFSLVRVLRGNNSRVEFDVLGTAGNVKLGGHDVDVALDQEVVRPELLNFSPADLQAVRDALQTALSGGAFPDREGVEIDVLGRPTVLSAVEYAAAVVGTPAVAVDRLTDEQVTALAKKLVDKDIEQHAELYITGVRQLKERLCKAGAAAITPASVEAASVIPEAPDVHDVMHWGTRCVRMSFQKLSTHIQDLCGRVIEELTAVWEAMKRNLPNGRNVDHVIGVGGPMQDVVMQTCLQLLLKEQYQVKGCWFDKCTTAVAEGCLRYSQAILEGSSAVS